jgi:hypothetical protein
VKVLKGKLFCDKIIEVGFSRAIPILFVSFQIIDGDKK